MDIIKWRESYETGIGSMDQQHRKLIELINRLYKIIRKKESVESIHEIMGEMTKYSENHLQEEEGILKSNGYPDFASHVAIHQDYLDKMKTLLAASEEDIESSVQETYAFLRHWWMDHIISEDKKYGEFLKSKGVD